MDDLPSYLSWSSLAFAFPLLLLVTFLVTSRSTTGSSTKLPPGPRPLPIIGNLHQVGGLPHRSLQKLSQKFGDIVYLQLGRVPAVVISSAELAERVMKTHDLEFCSRPQTVAFKKLTYNFLDVAFSPYGDTWRHMRKIMTIEILSNRRVQLARDIREEEVARLVKKLAQANSSGNHFASVDLTDMAMDLAENIVCRVVLGKSWFSIRDATKSKLFEPLEEARAMLGSNFMADYCPWAWWVDVARGWQHTLEECFRGLDDYYDEVIDEHLHHQTEVIGTEDFVDVLIGLERNSGLTRDHTKAVLMNIFLAGLDTNSTMIVWAMCELLRNRQAMTKAQEEVRQAVGNKGKVDEDDLKELHYLKAIIKETMRVHPPGPLLIPRETMLKCTINDYEIPPKTLVMVNVFSISRDPRYWENPLKFLPERFLKGSIDFKGQHFELLPFEAGRRICPGIQFAMTIVELTLANLLYSFDWNLPESMKKEDIDMTEKHGVSVCKKTPLVVVPKPVCY